MMPCIQKQKWTYDCALASLASLLDLDYEATFPLAFQEETECSKGTRGYDGFKKVFEFAGLREGIDWITLYLPNAIKTHPHAHNLFWGRRALFQVPSLNVRDSSHIIAWTGSEILDPSQKQVYRWIEKLPIEAAWVFNENK